MSLFENFPYTNLHELNLDWLIEELKMVKESAVISVNGQTGEVILYQDPDIEFPATDNGGWDMVRKVDGTIAAGIRFTADGVAYLITGAQVKQLYDANHQPPYPVTSVNGQTGEVNLTFPVTSVNDQTGAVVLYSDQYVRLPDLTGEQLANWNFYRYVNSVIHGIQFDNDGRAYIMNGSARYQIYTENNAQPFTFVDNVNAGVMTISQDAPAGIWGFMRETDSGTAGIVFSYESTTPTAYLRYIDSNEVTHNVKLLTPDDIPSSAGVVSINGLTGVVVLTGDAILSTSGGSLSVAQVLTNIESELARVESDIGIVINGSTASQNVSTGQYVIVKNSTITGITDGLYTSRYNISANTIFTASDLVAVTNGGLNDLLDDVTTLNDQIGTLNTAIANIGSYTDKGSIGTLDALETILTTELSGMSNNTVKLIRFTGSANFDVFQNGIIYLTEIKKYSDTYASFLFHATAYDIVIIGSKNNTTWKFDVLALKSELTKNKQDSSIDISAYTTGNRYTIPADGYLYTSITAGYVYVNGADSAVVGSVSGTTMTFLRKGMICYCSNITGSAYFKTLKS